MAKQTIREAVISGSVRQGSVQVDEQTIEKSFISGEAIQGSDANRLRLPKVGEATGKWAVVALAVVGIAMIVYVFASVSHG